MAQETAPAFQFYVKEWRSSRAVQRMSFAERGMYLEMLLEQWENYSLPDDPAAVADLVGGTVEEWVAAWPVLRRKFVERRRVGRPSEHSSQAAQGRIWNLRLERVRRERRLYRQNARLGGIKRALSAKRGKDGTYTPAANPADIQPSTSTASPTPTATPSASATAYGTPPADARSKRPIFKGRRFVVFEWMLDDLRRLLGTHAEAFDLHAWFFDLDERAEREGAVVPQRDGGAWLQSATTAEAIRRGIPVEAPRAVGKTAGNVAAVARFAARGNA